MIAGPVTEAGGADIFVAKYDSSGTFRWVQKYGDASYQYAQMVRVDTAGHVIVTGAVNGMVDFGGGVLSSGGGADMFLLKLTP